MRHEWKALEFHVFSTIKKSGNGPDQTVCDIAWPLLESSSFSPAVAPQRD